MNVTAAIHAGLVDVAPGHMVTVDVHPANEYRPRATAQAVCVDCEWFTATTLTPARARQAGERHRRATA